MYFELATSEPSPRVWIPALLCSQAHSPQDPGRVVLVLPLQSLSHPPGDLVLEGGPVLAVEGEKVVPVAGQLAEGGHTHPDLHRVG